LEDKARKYRLSMTLAPPHQQLMMLPRLIQPPPQRLRFLMLL
jgi:hypothetical protein